MSTTPLTQVQMGIYVECMQMRGQIAYNLPYLYIFSPQVDAERLCDAVQSAFNAHPVFFSRIVTGDGGEPAMLYGEPTPMQLRVEDIDDIDEVCKHLIQPIDLETGPLFHVNVMRAKDHVYLFLDIHHMVCDGTTLNFLIRDIERAYAGEEVAAETFTMADVAREEVELRQTETFEQARAWYTSTFDCGDLDTMLLPDRHDEQRVEHSQFRAIALTPEQVDRYGKEHGVFKSNYFITAYGILMARTAGEQQSLFTTVYNGRKDKRIAHTAGMFVKTLPVFTQFKEGTKVIDLLHDMQDQMSGCRKNDIYSFTDLHHDTGINTQGTLFVYQGELFDAGNTFGYPSSVRRLINSTSAAAMNMKIYIIDGKYQLKAEYDASRYSDELVAQHLMSYEAVLMNMMHCECVEDIPVALPEQVELLDKFNLTDAPYDSSQTIVSLFRQQVALHPTNVAVVYCDKRYTYAQVDELSERIAQHIVQSGLQRGDVVSVLIERSEWMPIASLGALKAGCAYQPLDPTYPAERLNFMVKDAGAKLLIAHEALRDIVNEYEGPVLPIGDILKLPPATQPVNVTIEPNDLFILLYTSGTTGVPKGCQLEHGNLVAFVNWYQRHNHLTAEKRVAAYASYGFDACMMDMYPALTCGATLHIIPEDMRLDLMAINDYFEREGITHGFMTTQVAYQFATSIENHSLQCFITGGEKLASLQPPAGYNLYNGYGPTETTILTTVYHVDHYEYDIPIGRPVDNMRLYIVDARGRRQPVGSVGELWISGPQVSRGYLNRPDKTAEVYIDNPFDDSPTHRRIYRSGDIVRYLPSGDIQFVGRRDGQVKIRGFRIELKEVESVIRQFPGVTDATVQAFDYEAGGKFIAAYVVYNGTLDVDALNEFILDQKPPYMVPAVTMQIDRIPLNQNQKVNRRALPQPEKKAAESTQQVAAPLNVLEQELHDIVADVIKNDDFDIVTTLGLAGLTSITAIKLATMVFKRYGVTLDSKTLVKTATVQSIENEILTHLLSQDASAATATPAAMAQKYTDAELTYAQTGVYFECLKNPASTVYNIPYMLTYPQSVSAQALQRAVHDVLSAHPEFGVHFDTKGDAIVQSIADAPVVEVSLKSMNDDELLTYKHDFVRPFNLSKAPLYRAEVVETPAGVHLLLDVHHLLFDGGSMDIIMRQISSALEGQQPEVEQYDYLQFSHDQQLAEQSEAFAQAKKFFDEHLSACEGASEIAADLRATDQPGMLGEVVVPVEGKAVASYAQQHGVTPAHVYLAATAYVVSRYTASRDVYLCTVSSGRSNVRIADTVGMFVNTLAIGLNVPDATVEEFIKQTSETFDQTLRHEDYPLARIAAEYGFNPAIAFAYQVGVMASYKVNNQPVDIELLELKVPKFKVNVGIEERNGAVCVVVKYDDARYTQHLMQGLAQSIAVVASRFADSPSQAVRKVSIVSAEQAQVLDAMRMEGTGDAPFNLLHAAVEHHAATTPEHTALVAIDGTFTYAEANSAMNRIAHSLMQRGVKPRDRVALLLPRTSRLILSLVGVLKAGAAYIPCDPEYPADRVQLILNDSEAQYVITTADRIAEVGNRAIDVEELLQNDDDTNPVTDVTPDDLAYLIYTSGSTGRPKGVMLRHEGICNYLYGHPVNVFAHAVATLAERILSVTTISFDAALQDIGTSLYNGKTLVLATEEQANNPLELARIIADEKLDMVSGTPSRWLTWLTSDVFAHALASVKIVRAGGEKFSDQLLQQLRSATKARIFNCYGPTEITVASNNKELTTAPQVTVGRPQLNYKEFIVDADGNELPVGVVGELYIGGRGVGRGYNNLDEMTRERFIDYHGTRVYRSGDYAKWLPDGDVVILGRTDNQIKLRGLRIELGEIENVMLAVDGIKKVVILIRKIGGKEHLCAYFTADKRIAIDELKAEIGKHLTQYMVPTAYLQLDAMPMTPNGKTDVKRLPEPELATSAAYEEPVDDVERTFCDIFASILSLERVGATDNFFDLGGTSLVVTRVIIEADKAGYHVAYGEVFANPTPRRLARLVGGGVADDAEGNAAANYDYTAINKLLEQNTLGTFMAGERAPLGNVLLTGATGFLGIHILQELIASEAPVIYCLVRGRSMEQAERRLKTLLFYYFDTDHDDLFGSRIKVVLGDVTNDIKALVADKVDTVFNCAAIVKHFSEGTEIEDVNIGGAQRCVEFCLATGARLIHISTASTRGLSVNGAVKDTYTEQRLYIGQYLGNQYIFSKYMAERLILEAMAEHGLVAKIMRVGNLSARSTDGEFQANFSTNSFMGRLKVYNMLGCCPYAMSDKAVEFSPINEVSHAIVLLATTPAACCVFHPYNNHTELLGDVLTELREIGDGVRFVEQDEFERVMDEAKADPTRSKLLSSLLAYQDMAHGQKTTDVARNNAYTIQVLYRLGYRWSRTTWDYIDRFLRAIAGLGFFDI